MDVTSADVNLDLPSLIPLYVRDISQLRLEKKGLCGLTDAPDSVASAMLPKLPTPASEIAALRRQVAYAQYALDQQQALLDMKNKLLNQQAQVIASAEAALRNAEDGLANIPAQIANLKNQIVSTTNQIAGVDLKSESSLPEPRRGFPHGRSVRSRLHNQSCSQPCMAEPEQYAQLIYSGAE